VGFWSQVIVFIFVRLVEANFSSREYVFVFYLLLKGTVFCSFSEICKDNVSISCRPITVQQIIIPFTLGGSYYASLNNKQPIELMIRP
jgi:hypothetical protein